MRPLSGTAAGINLPVLVQSGDEFTLSDPPPTDIVGAPVRIVEGCDRTLAACAFRFANAVNFQGEPHLPGNDLLARYAG
jgi:hypothetical protein